LLTTFSKCFPKLVNVSPFLKPAAASSQLQERFAGPQAGVHIVILPWQNLVWRRNHGRLVLSLCHRRLQFIISYFLFHVRKFIQGIL
jgi:hypothetical protein